MASDDGAVGEHLLDDMHLLLASTWDEHAGVDEADRDVLATALSEIVSNIVRHGVHVSSATIEVRVEDDAVVAIVRDDGEALDADIVERATWPEDVFAETGRGLVMARDNLDELRYERVGDGNVWTLVRRRSDVGA